MVAQAHGEPASLGGEAQRIVEGVGQQPVQGEGAVIEPPEQQVSNPHSCRVRCRQGSFATRNRHWQHNSPRRAAAGSRGRSPRPLIEEQGAPPAVRLRSRSKGRGLPARSSAGNARPTSTQSSPSSIAEGIWSGTPRDTCTAGAPAGVSKDSKRRWIDLDRPCPGRRSGSAARGWCERRRGVMAPRGRRHRPRIRAVSSPNGWWWSSRCRS